MLLLTIFAVIALVLASVGIYGVMSYTTAQRTNEIGIRMALGARQGTVLGMVLRTGFSLVLIGSALGAGISVVVMHVVSSRLYKVPALDLATFPLHLPSAVFG